jgi:hypothetical protein
MQAAEPVVVGMGAGMGPVRVVREILLAAADRATLVRAVTVVIVAEMLVEVVRQIAVQQIAEQAGVAALIAPLLRLATIQRRQIMERLGLVRMLPSVTIQRRQIMEQREIVHIVHVPQQPLLRLVRIEMVAQ